MADNATVWQAQLDEAAKAKIDEQARKIRHLKIRAYEVYEKSLPEGKGPRNPNERNEMMQKFMREIDNELVSCGRCCGEQ